MPKLTSMSATVGALLKERQQTIAVTESSCGGLISASLVAVPGCSAFYVGGATEGLNYLCSVDFEKLKDYRVWREALCQIAWSTGSGWGRLMT